MMESPRAALVVVALIGALSALLSAPGVARANHMPSNARVSPSQPNEAAASAGDIVYTITGKVDGNTRSCPVPPAGCSDRPTLQAVMPPGTTFVTCKTTPLQNPEVLCTRAGSIVTAQFQTVAAHKEVNMILTVKAPAVSTETTIVLSAKFFGDNMHMDEKTLSTLVLPLTTTLKMLPSGSTVQVACGNTISAATFGNDTEGVIQSGMVCDNGSGLTITASGKTLNLAGKKIFSGKRVKGNAGIIVGPNALNVTINGGGTGGGRGVEQFEYCIKDLGGNTGLHITALRCFRAKGAGILVVSNDVLIDNSLVDRATPDSRIEIPGGGIGIQAGGDNIHIKDTIIRRSFNIGFWAHGVDTDGSGLVTTYDGNIATSRIEDNFGIGVVLSGGPHRIKSTQVLGDDFEAGTSLAGIVVESDAQGTVIDEVVVKKHHGDGIRVEAGATDTVIARTSVEEIGGSGYVIDSPSRLNGNSAMTVLGDGFVINTSATLTSNNVEESGTGFVINGPAIVEGNSAADNRGYGFVVANIFQGRVPPDWSIIAVADFNGDGAADILWRHTSGTLAVWLLNTNGTSVMATGVLAGAGSDWTVVDTGDLDGDGKADILWRHTSGAVAVWLMSGSTVTGVGVPGSVRTDWTIVGVGDFNGDGKADILWRHTSGAVVVWFMNGLAVSSVASPGGITNDWTIVGVGDFNGDGKADILWRHTSGTVAIWLMNGTTVGTVGVPGAAGTDWTIVGVGDFNSDGKADILWRHNSGSVAIWLMQGTGILSSGIPGSKDKAWSVQGVGKAEILWRSTSGEVSTWFMDGTSLASASGSALLRTNTAERNAVGGFLVSGSGNTITSNTAKNSGGLGFEKSRGFDITGNANVLNTNAAASSTGPEFGIAASNIDDGNNRASGNRFSFTAAGGTFE